MLPPRLLSWPVCLLVLASAFGADVSPGRPLSAGMLIVNEDNSHFFGSRPAEAMTREGLVAWVDGYAGTKVTHLFLNTSAMRASFRSRTREAIWDPVDGAEPKELWPQNAKRLHEAGLDPYAVWIGRAREVGISPWVSLRMNDVHSVEAVGNFMHSSFWRDHPELRRRPGPPGQPWTDYALNYAHQAVRDYQFAHVRELLERYDADGLELDWLRFPYHLTPGKEREEGALLDAFVRDVRGLTEAWAKRRGHPIRLGVRVPAHPEAAAGLGLDAVRWARAGWVDLIVAGPFFRSSDFEIPLELWREQLGPVAGGVTVVPGFEHNLRAWVGGVTVPNDLASLHGFAAAMHRRGADSLYLFNWMDSQTRPVSAEDYRRLLREGLAPAVVAASPQRYPVTYRDTVPAGFPDNTQLPVEGGGRFQVPAGRIPAGRSVAVLIGLAERPGMAAASFAVEVNGRPVAGEPVEVAGPRTFGGAARALQWRLPAGLAVDGSNQVRVTPAGPEAKAQQVVWVELRVGFP